MLYVIDWERYPKIESNLKRQIKALNPDRVREAAQDMSTPEIQRQFSGMLWRHGRAAVAIVVAATIDARRDRLFNIFNEWADAILDCWSNRPASLKDFIINDNLNPIRLCFYAKEFIDSTLR